MAPHYNITSRDVVETTRATGPDLMPITVRTETTYVLGPGSSLVQDPGDPSHLVPPERITQVRERGEDGSWQEPSYSFRLRLADGTGFEMRGLLKAGMTLAERRLYCTGRDLFAAVDAQWQAEGDYDDTGLLGMLAERKTAAPCD